MNNYENIESILLRMKTTQEHVVAAEKKFDEYFKKIVPFMNKINADVGVASGGVIPNGIDFVEADQVSVANEEEFVETMAKIRWMSSYVQKIRAYSIVLNKLSDLRKSARNKEEKLNSRIKYMDMHDQGKSQDYISSMLLRRKTRDAISVITRRMEVVATRMLKVRTKILDLLGTITLDMCVKLDDCVVVARCALKNDDGGCIVKMNRFDDIVKKGMREDD